MRRLWPVPVLALVLAGCGGGTPAGQVRGDVEAIIDAANFRNAESVRSEVDDLLSTLSKQVAENEIDRTKAEQLRTLALRIKENADLLESGPTPTPTPEPTAEPTTEPSPSPSPEPSPTPEPEETEEPEPEETEEPEPIISIGVGGSHQSPTPSQVSQGAESSPEPKKPSPQPTA